MRSEKKNTKIIEDSHLRNSLYVFKDRKEAGLYLAELLEKNLPLFNAIILAIPSGGIPVGLEIAKKLKIHMDLIIVRKIQLPGNTEAGFGAMGPDFKAAIDERLVKRLGLTKNEMEEQINKTKDILQKRNELFRKGKPFPEISGKTVILTDDGLASGYTMQEAIKFVKRKGVERVIVAVPTAPEETIYKIIDLVDEIYCPNIRNFYPFAVADAYKKWYDISDEEVVDLLQELKKFNLN